MEWGVGEMLEAGICQRNYMCPTVKNSSRMEAFLLTHTVLAVKRVSAAAAATPILEEK